MQFFFFSSRRRHTRFLPVSWARRCVQETGYQRRVHGELFLEMQKLLLIAATLAIVSAVKMTVYFESECPASRLFLGKSFGSWLDAIVEARDTDAAKNLQLEFVPLGNAAKGDDGEYQCQHGPEECKGNSHMACVNELFTGLSKWRFFVCWVVQLEKTKYNIDQATDNCANTLGLDLYKIKTCYETGQFREILDRYYNQTLNERDEFYVPYIQLDGVHDTDAEIKIKTSFLNWYCEQPFAKSSSTCTPEILEKFGQSYIPNFRKHRLTSRNPESKFYKHMKGGFTYAPMYFKH
eukprot:TRINITY_DN55_c0_g1_i1.p1 TRINITY_DN55_c0_g1~~TRINITY_DN55_c0_g1_i1.p1  ORF type:complete len:293 (-),score=83.16 TRINITY_DN55_c0_g1_i1:95-973(-)